MTRRAEHTPASLGISTDGIASGMLFVPSPNWDERPAHAEIELLIVHAISLPPGEFGGTAIQELFLNRLDPAGHPYFRGIAALRVSAHFLIRRDGTPFQYVACGKRAWHAGESSWRGRPRCNDFSIGVELEGCDELPFEDAQYDTLVALTQALKTAYPILDVVGHSDVAPGRKTDPGPYFDWPQYRARIAD